MLVRLAQVHNPDVIPEHILPWFRRPPATGNARDLTPEELGQWGDYFDTLEWEDLPGQPGGEG